MDEKESNFSILYYTDCALYLAEGKREHWMREEREREERERGEREREVREREGGGYS